MKKHLWGLFVLCLFVCAPAWAGNSEEGAVTRDVPIRGILDVDDDDTILRSIRMPSITVTQTDAQLTINFQTGIQSTVFKVTNLTTGAVVYTETVQTPGTIIIDLTGEDEGEYLLEMRMPYWYFSGSFTLE